MRTAIVRKGPAARRLFLGFIIALLTPLGFAQSTSTVPSGPNGCGSGWSRYFVPNSVPILACNFTNACNAHDVCYGLCAGSVSGDCAYLRCRKGGDLFAQKSDLCMTDVNLLLSGAKASARRKSCDDNFYTRLRADNPARWACLAFAVIYRDAVKSWGEVHFNGADAFKGPPQPQQEYEGAIKEFFDKGTEQQFRRIVQEYDAGTPSLDLRRQIFYSPVRGLTNKKGD